MAMGKQARLKRERKETKAVVKTRAFDELSIADIDMMITQLHKRRVALIHETHNPGMPIDHGGLTGYEGYTLGLDVYNAVADIMEAHLTIGWHIVEVIDVVLSTEGLPKDWQPQILRNWLAQKAKTQPLDERLRDACYALRSAVDDLLPVVTMNGFAIEMLDPDGLIAFANEIMSGIRKLSGDNNLVADNGETLRDVIDRNGGENLRQQIEAMRESAPRMGRRGGPTPVTKYILERTAYLKTLRNLKSATEEVSAFVEELNQREDVQDWKRFLAQWRDEKDPEKRRAIKIEDELTRRSVEVQAFHKFDSADRREWGDMLRKDRKNNKEWLKKGGLRIF